MKERLHMVRFSFLCIMGVLFSLSSFAQERVISGKLTDFADGSPLIGASIVVKGTSNGTVTDADGKYKLSVAEDATTLLVSYIGYETQEVAIGNQSIINFDMVPDLTQLEEIIVVGYGSVKKSDLTGSVASVSAEELTAYPAIDAIQALQGRAAGVSVTSTNGEPGSAYKIQIRGNTSINASNAPLFVIDGFIGGTMPPPEDIASVEILKDASATAIYGARGANGVVIVTTKRGESGKTQINFSSSWSSQETINRLDLLNADQFTTYVQEIDPTYVPELTGAGTDWQDEIYRKGGIQNYQLSIGGGSDKVSYYVSGVVFDQKGVVEDSKYSRYSLTSNIDIKASKIFNFGANVFVRRDSRNGIRTQEGGDASQTGVISGAYKFMPTQGVRDANGDFTTSDRGFEIDNPYAMATELENETINDLYQGSVYAEINILEGLKFKTTLNTSARNSRNGLYYPRTLIRGDGVDGEATLAFAKRSTVISENYFTYSKTFADVHAVTLMAGYSYQKDRTERLWARASGFVSDSFTFWNLGNGTDIPLVSSARVDTEYEAFYGRLNYTLNDKYLLTVTGRSESSSVFAENNKTGFFPSAALGWKVSNEGFMSGVSTINVLKLRASLGQVGNQAIAPYQSLATLGTTTTTVPGGGQVPALFVDKIANADLSWETTTQLDIGIDLEVFEGRIGVTADYYIMTTEDLLFRVDLPTTFGTPFQLQNVGTVENKGFEFAINAGVLQGDFKWHTSANITFNKNKILKLSDNETDGNDRFYSSSPLPGAGQTQILREGESVGAFWGFVYTGVSQAGDSILVNGEGLGGESFRDLDANDTLTAEDRTIIGDPNPDFIWGWNNDFSYKGFSLNIFIQGSKGGEMLDYTRMELGVLNGNFNATTDALNRWTPATNTNTDIPMASASRGYVTSDRWISDASYVRVKNISLSYNLPQSLLSNIGLRTARVYVSGQNLLTFTKYKGLDPEVAYRNSSSNIGLDYGSYPNVKSYTVGLNIGF